MCFLIEVFLPREPLYFQSAAPLVLVREQKGAEGGRGVSGDEETENTAMEVGGEPGQIENVSLYDSRSLRV